jgi:hypothetical protein
MMGMLAKTKRSLNKKIACFQVIMLGGFRKFLAQIWGILTKKNKKRS